MFVQAIHNLRGCKFALLCAALLSSIASAQFIVQYPLVSGTNNQAHPLGPCGGSDPTTSATYPKSAINGFAISITTSNNTRSQFQLRATLDFEEPFSWTELLPAVTVKGSGDFCWADLVAPAGWAEKSGIVQVIQQSPNQTLYQCTPVKFVPELDYPDNFARICHNDTTVSFGDNNTATSSGGDSTSTAYRSGLWVSSSTAVQTVAPSPSSAPPAAQATESSMSSALGAQATAGILAAGLGFAAAGFALV